MRRNDLELIIDFYYDKPVEFAQDILNFQPTTYQREIMLSVLNHKRTAIKSGRGVGKSSCISCIILWYLFTRRCKILLTAPTLVQVFTVLFSEIAIWRQGTILDQFMTQTKTKMYINGHDETWYMFGKTGTNKEQISGIHDKRLLVIVDEASGVRSEILETLIATCSGELNKLVFISNPTCLSGAYYDAFHINRKDYNCITINAEDSPLVDKNNLEMLKQSYGRDSNVYRTSVLGEFPSSENDTFISLELIMTAVNKETHIMKNGTLVLRASRRGLKYIMLGVDVARFGEDYTAITINVDGNIDILEKYNNQSITYTSGVIVQHILRLSAQYPDISIRAVIDDIGVGGGLTDRLKELLETDLAHLRNRVSIVPCNVAKNPKHTRYANFTTYLLGMLKEDLIAGKVALPNDQDLIAELATRKFQINSNGKVVVENKKEYKKRLGRSCDLADSVMLTFYPFNMSEDRVEPKERNKKPVLRSSGRKI